MTSVMTSALAMLANGGGHRWCDVTERADHTGLTFTQLSNVVVWMWVQSCPPTFLAAPRFQSIVELVIQATPTRSRCIHRDFCCRCKSVLCVISFFCSANNSNVSRKLINLNVRTIISWSTVVLVFLFPRTYFLFFLIFFVSVPCARLSWPSRQLLSARKSTVSYRIYLS